MRKKNYLQAVLVGVLGILIGAFYMSQSVKNSASYEVAYRFLEENQMIITKLGKIKSIEYYPFGHSMVDRGSSGYAEYRFDLETDKGKSKIFIELTKRLGKWEVENAVLDITNTGERVPLK